MQLDATVKGASANSYVSVADADDYFSRHTSQVAWATIGFETKESVLIMATRILDTRVMWFGYKATDDQNLRWPRSFLYDQDGKTVDSDTIPSWLTAATCELALYLNDNNGTATPDGGVSRVKVGPIDLDLTTSNGLSIPNHVAQLVSFFGDINPSMVGSKLHTAMLIRT